MVEVDPDTGNVEFWNTTASTMRSVINPMIVNGQIHGGIAQGIQAGDVRGSDLSEQHGRIIARLPVADGGRPSSFDLSRTVTPTPVNPMGVKESVRPARSARPHHRQRGWWTLSPRWA